MAQCNWSAENATNAYLRTLKMGSRGREQEPDISEFISAIAAGNNSQLMVIACTSVDPMGPTCSAVLALLAAAHQTGGHVICILPTPPPQTLIFELQEGILNNSEKVECVVGDAETLMANEYSKADFVVVDCNLDNHERVLQIVNKNCNEKGVVVLGYNAFRAGSWRSSCGGKEKAATQLLPIGEGLLITRVAGKGRGGGRRCGVRKGTNWVVRVDEVTGEEHVFRVRIPHGNLLHA